MPYEIPNNNYNPYGYEPIQRPMIPANGMMMQAPIPDTPLAIGDVVNAIREVQRNPSGFSMDEINRARELSMQYLGKDIEFANDLGRTVANTLFDAVDTLAFGLIPDSVGEKFGAKKLSSADEIGSMIGSTAALFTPGVGPMAVSTKIAKKFLPSIAKIGTGAIANVGKVAGEGAGAAAVEGAAKGVGKVANWLGSDMAAARIGSAIGGGFNFEDGINPTGAVLGAMFPMGAKGVGAVSKVENVGTQAIKSVDDVNAILKNIGPLERGLYKAIKNNAPIDIKEVAKMFKISEQEVMSKYQNLREVFKRSEQLNAELRVSKGMLLNQGKPPIPPTVVPTGGNNGTVSYLDEINDIVSNNNRYAEDLYNAKSKVRSAKIPGLDAQGRVIPMPKNKTEMTVAIDNEIAQAKNNLKEMADINPEYAKYIQTLEQIWQTPVGKEEILRTAMKNMTDINPQFGSQLDDIWGISSSFRR